MAIDKRLQIYDEQGNLVDYDILASDVKFLPDGKDLPTKLAEMQDEIEDAGSGDGTVTGVKIGSTTYEPTDGVVDLSSPMGNKVDKETGKGLSTNDYTTAEKTKLGSLPTNPVQTISVNGGTPATPVNGNVNISVEGGGSVESVTVSGTKYTPDINGDVDLGNLRGQDGNSGVASADGMESVNNLNGGTTDTQSKVYVLGANQGKRLRDQIELVYQRIQTLYGLLGNIAFWEGKPASSALLPDLDWGNPKHKVTLALTLSNAVVKDGLGNTLSNGAEIQVEEGGTLTLTVEPASGYALTGAPTVSTGADVTDLGNGTYSVAIAMGQSNLTLNITATGAAERSVTLNLTGCTKVSGPTSIADGEGGTFVFDVVDSNDTLFPAIPHVEGASLDSWDSSTGTLVIEDVSDNVIITMVSTSYLLKLGEVITIVAEDGYYYASAYAPRACLLIQRSAVDYPCTWSIANKPADANSRNDTNLSTIPIPSGTTKVSLQCNSSYSYGLTLVNASGVPQNTIEWTPGSTKKELVLANYPNATHIAVNFKKSSGNFSSETYSSMEIELTIE